MKTTRVKEFTSQVVNRGLIIKPIVENDHYVFGGYGSLGGDMLQPDGQWDAWLPEDEFQARRGIDPQDCVTHAILNAVEILGRRKYGDIRNWSDRFLAKSSGTTETGNDPHKVGEALRKQGVVVENLWPFDPSITTWAEFYKDIPRALYVLATQFIAEYAFGHEWVATTPSYLMAALRYSPIAISVYAWYPDNDPNSPTVGLMIKPPGVQDTHLCVLYGFEEGKFWKVFDTYDNTHKKVAWNTNFQLGKRVKLDRQVNTSTGLWQRFLTWLGLAAAEIAQPPVAAPVAPAVPEPAPTPVPPAPAPESPLERIHQAALHYLGKDASPNDAAPDEYGCADSVSAILHEAFPDFPAPVLSTVELVKQLRAHPKFRATLDMKPGVVIVSPTVGSKTGHTGICLDWQRIASNNSRKGVFEDNYSLTSWANYFRGKLGLKVLLFERISA